MSKVIYRVCALLGAAILPSVLTATVASAQSAAATKSAAPPSAKAADSTNVPPPPPGYVIGADDVLSILYWRDKDMTTDVQVRPDGMISLPLLNDIAASGLTPSQLRDRLMEESQKLMEDPNVTVVVKQINSRKVYITGQVGKQGPYPLNGSTTVLQLIALAGGLGEYADSKNIVLLRTENGRQVAHKINYKDVVSGKKLNQNIELKPGDTVIVP
jgi:polysaccharide export outer membrane protein